MEYSSEVRAYQQALAKKGGEGLKAKYGVEYFRSLAAKGGRAGKGVKKPRKNGRSR